MVYEVVLSSSAINVAMRIFQFRSLDSQHLYLAWKMRMLALYIQLCTMTFWCATKSGETDFPLFYVLSPLNMSFSKTDLTLSSSRFVELDVNLEHASVWLGGAFEARGACALHAINSRQLSPNEGDVSTEAPPGQGYKKKGSELNCLELCYPFDFSTSLKSISRVLLWQFVLWIRK